MATNRIMQGLAVAAVLSLGAAATQAAVKLELSDGLGNVVSVLDGGVGDFNPIAGVVTYLGAVGPNWNINVTTGSPDAVVPWTGMDLNTVDGSRGAGTLTIKWSETGFLASGATQIKVGGTTSGNVVYKAYADAANVFFGTSTFLAGTGPLTSAFSAAGVGNHTPATPYSLTQEVIITHGGFGLTSLNAELAVVPEPSSYLAGLGALGMLGLFGWKSRK